MRHAKGTKAAMVALQDADLTDANLHGSDCTGAKWDGAILDRVVWDNCVAVPKEAEDFEQWEARERP